MEEDPSGLYLSSQVLITRNIELENKINFISQKWPVAVVLANSTRRNNSGVTLIMLIIAGCDDKK